MIRTDGVAQPRKLFPIPRCFSSKQTTSDNIIVLNRAAPCVNTTIHVSIPQEYNYTQKQEIFISDRFRNTRLTPATTSSKNVKGPGHPKRSWVKR